MQFRKIARGQLHAGVNPELIPIIAKMAKNRVEKGVVNLAEVVDAIHEKVSDYLDKRQIEKIS